MWYRFAAAANDFKNLYPEVFYVERKNQSGEIKYVPVQPGETHSSKKWSRILGVSYYKVNDEVILNQTISSNIRDLDGKKIFRLIPNTTLKPIKNLYPEVFYVERKNDLEEIEFVRVKPGEDKGILAWAKFLVADPDNVNSEKKLNRLLNSRIIEKDGKKVYPILNRNYELINNIEGGFWVYEKNDFGEINEKPSFIPFGKKGNQDFWRKLLSTRSVNLTGQDVFENFLSKRIVVENNKNIYRPYAPSTFIKNPIQNGFYVNGEEIKSDRVLNISEWSSLLNTNREKITDEAKLRNFLLERIVVENKKNIYRPYVPYKMIKNPLRETFWVGKKPIEPDTELNCTEWKILLRTDAQNVKDEESLRDFLSDPRRFDTFNNKKTYKPLRRSIREGLFGQKFNSYNHDDITVKAGQYIIVMTNKTNILYLDFAFIKNNKILLAIEINGEQHYGFVSFGKKRSYQDWQDGLKRDVLKINYCHNNNIPLLIFNHMLSTQEFKTILDNLHNNPHAYDNFVPQSVINDDTNNTSLEFIKRQIYSHLYPVFNGTIAFKNDESKKRYIKDTLILISKLLGIYEDGIDKTDYINSFDLSTDLTSNYNICLSIYNSLYPDFPLDSDVKITYSDLSKPPRLQKEKSPIKKPAENLIPSEG